MKHNLQGKFSPYQFLILFLNWLRVSEFHIVDGNVIGNFKSKYVIISDACLCSLQVLYTSLFFKILNFCCIVRLCCFSLSYYISANCNGLNSFVHPSTLYVLK